MSEGAVPTPVTLEELLAQARWIRRLASQLVVGEDAADELAQAGIVQALTHPPRHSGNLRAWFAVVLRNLARHQGVALRREREERAASVELGRAEHESSEQIVMRLETQQLVGEALLQLDPAHRDVLVLRFYDELSFREIGDRLGIPQATARSRTERALEELRKRLDLLGGDAELDWRAGVALWVGAGWRRGAPAGTSAGPAVPLLVTSLVAGALVVAWWGLWRSSDESSKPEKVAALDAPVVAATNDLPAAFGTDVADQRSAVPPLQDALLEPRIVYEGVVLRDDTGEPLAGARVRLLFDGGYRRRACVLEATTDDAGRYLLEGPPTAYEPRAEDLLCYHHAQVVLRVEHDDRFAFHEARETIRGLVRWNSGDPPVRHRRETLRLARAVQPTALLRGDWADSGGVWLADVPKSSRALDRWRQVGAWDGSRRVTWWDALGARIHDDTPLVLLAWDGTRYAALELDLPPDGPAGRDLVFEAPPVAQVAVRVQQPDGTPVAGRTVMAHPGSWPLRAPHATDQCEHRVLVQPRGFHAARTAITDEKGLALFPALPAAPAAKILRQRPSVTGEGLYPQGTYVFCAPELDATGVLLDHRASLPTRVFAEEQLELTLVLADGQRGLQGVVVDPQGRPIADLELVATDYAHSDPLLDGGALRGRITATTDANGRFRLVGLDDQGQGFEDLLFKGADFGLANLSRLVSVPDQGVRDLGTVVLPSAHVVSGYLVDAFGDPVSVEGAYVGCRALSLDPHRPLASRPWRTPVHSTGSFSWDALPSGPKMLYPIDFESAGLAPFEPFEFDPEGPELTIRVDRLDDARTHVAFRVLAADETAAVRRAVALLEREGATPLVIDAELGADARSFEWEALPPGDWWVGVSMHGGDRHWRSLALDGSQPSVLRDLRLLAEGSLIGSLGEGVSSTSLSGGVVEARIVGPSTADGGPGLERELAATPVQATIEGNGSFRFESLHPGRYELRLVEGAVVVRDVVVVAPGVETRASLDPRPARRLVLEGDPRPFLDQRMQLALVLTDAEGVRYDWPVELTADGAVAWIPASATAWDAGWWAPPSNRGTVPATALLGRTRGAITADRADEVVGRLPR